MSAAAPRADFKLILNAVNPANASAIVAELMEVLSIDRPTAVGAIQNAPIILIGGMTQPQAATLRTHLVRLSRLGAQLRLTAEPVGKLKQFRWQQLPPAVRRPANIFVCPGCGERFVVQRLQPAAAPRPAPAQAAAAAAAAPAPEPEAQAVAAPAEEALPAAEEIPEAEPVEADLQEAEEIPEATPAEPSEVAELAEFLDSILESAPAQEAAEAAPAEEPEPIPAQEAASIPEAAFVPEAVLAPEPAPAPQAAPEPAPAPEPVPQAARVESVTPPRAAPAEPRPLPRPARPAPAEKPKPEAPAGPRYDVSVAKVRGRDAERLAELLVERQGISLEEAQKQCERTVLLVCKGGTSVEAEEWRRALVQIGIKPRIKKR